jgi:hypothetical protein
MSVDPDDTEYPVLNCGIATQHPFVLPNGDPLPGNDKKGTIGGFGTAVDSVTGQTRQVFFTNAHCVVPPTQAPIARGRAMGHPDYQACPLLHTCCDTICGHTLLAAFDSEVDAAVVALQTTRNGDPLKWQSVLPEDINVPAFAGVYTDQELDALTDDLLNQPGAQPFVVSKRGRTTRLTSGRLLSTQFDYFPPTDFPPNDPQNIVRVRQLLILHTSTDPGFSDHGDSGSIVYNPANRKVLGLLWGGTHEHPVQFRGQTIPNASFACRMTAVLDRLSATLATDSDVHVVPADNDAGLASALAATPALSQPMTERRPFEMILARKVMTHADEVRHLLRCNSRVAATWRRYKGQMFGRSLMAAVVEQKRDIPSEIDGVKFGESVRELSRALTRYGSSALRSDLAVIAPVLEQAGGMRWPEVVTSAGKETNAWLP